MRPNLWTLSACKAAHIRAPTPTMVGLVKTTGMCLTMSFLRQVTLGCCLFLDASWSRSESCFVPRVFAGPKEPGQLDWESLLLGGRVLGFISRPYLNHDERLAAILGRNGHGQRRTLFGG
ncbi:hypothetical protein BKA82DRAFT_623892 [Pisolithus tinctorius]|uniref:Uncharacterized protein n=1 Tax=Pisolithus tinctorius Marx 270 TaxID=870435 RepID=A0A0C3J358_PISTI|nr:hypothetical protein BKA82DRAFT_623892 [Pisolithus tinctorius]KIO03513.1 hypothetical protein M404DRAFT_623892 [Pisolithus tinctorius Marx 270]